MCNSSVILFIVFLRCIYYYILYMYYERKQIRLYSLKIYLVYIKGRHTETKLYFLENKIKQSFMRWNLTENTRYYTVVPFPI